ncbi:MAG: HAD family hydrolase [Jatrophihabitantaceae bacterium]
MTGTVLVAADLDRTLIYSKAALGLGPGQAPKLRCVELLEGKQASFMTETASGLLVELAGSAVLVPVTTRTPRQLERVTLPAPTRFAIAANGGMLFVDGELDRAWHKRVRHAVAEVASLDQVWARVSESCSPDWTLKLRTASSLFCYAVIDRAKMPSGFIDEITAWADGLGWSTSLQGRKLYWVPRSLTKSAAVAEVARRIEADLLLAAGDSLLDADLLLAADLGIQPRHGELFESGWSAPHVSCTEVAGVLAGEQICGWFLEWAAAHKAA